MWVIDMNGNARNLAQAYKIDFGEHKGKVKVYATFPVCTGKNTADPAFAETAVLESFDNVNDAKKFVFDIVNTMNNGNGIYNWDDFNADDDVDENQLGYSFSWLKKVEALPDDKRTELEGKITDWLADVSKPQAVKNENVPTSGDNPYLIDGIAL